jgi:hypothetical protein
LKRRPEVFDDRLQVGDFRLLTQNLPKNARRVFFPPKFTLSAS